MRKKTKDPVPVVIAFGDREAETVEFDPEEKQAFILRGLPGHLLVVAWDVNAAGQGAYRIKTIGVKDEEIVKKEFEPDKETAAFYGDVSIVGANKTDLYNSFGFDDDDLRDTDGFIVNKIKEIVIRPKQDG